MTKLSLGIIETVGLVAAIEAADIALKTTNVDLIGYEISNGDGFVTVKIQGDVSSVSEAIKAARISAAKINTVFSATIIARPHELLESMIFTDETVGIEKSKGAEILISNPTIEEEVEEVEEIEEIEEIKQIKEVEENKEEKKATCNLCMDPRCPRIKGENRNICIHHD